MTVLVYLTSASLECYSQSKDAIIKTKLTRNRSSCVAGFCKRHFKKPHKIHGQPVLESLFKEVAGLWIAALLKRGSSTPHILQIF